MKRHPHRARGFALALAGACALALGGCGDYVQLNGKIFDALGVSGNEKPEEPKLAARQPLVVPPSLERLPEPGSAPKRSETVIAGVNDPDEAKNKSKAELERAQAEYCEKYYEPARRRNEDEADLIKGPLGYCRGSVLTALPKLLKGDSDDDEENN